MNTRIIQQRTFSGERSLFQEQDLLVTESIFEDGESPVKECRRIELDKSIFKWKYPVWYSNDITLNECTWMEMARAGVWYSNNISVSDSIIEAPKNFRRCNGVSMRNVTMSNAAETLWNCRDVTLENISAKGDYFAMNSEDITVRGLSLVGGYCFDGVKNADIQNARLITKDAFWNSENVTVYDSFITSEYLGWNSKNLTLINCTIESLQGMCYIDNLVMKDCTLLNTTLAFEYSTVDVEVNGKIDSIKNPAGGIIRADSIGEITLDDESVDTEKTRIICHSEADELAKAI